LAEKLWLLFPPVAQVLLRPKTDNDFFLVFLSHCVTCGSYVAVISEVDAIAVEWLKFWFLTLVNMELVYLRPICVIRDGKLMSRMNVLVPCRGHLFQSVGVYKSLMCNRKRKRRFKTP